jgi:lysophospholipase L1-like esterase
MELAKKGGINVLFVGDSITAGWHGGWGSKGSMEAWDRYFAPLGGAVFGIGGEHIGPLNWRLWNGELECRPKVVVLQAGANDLIRDAGGEDVAAGLLQIVANILEKSPKTKVLLIGPLPYGGGGDRKEFYSYSFQESWVVANKVLARTDFGGRPVKYLDVGNVFLDEEGNIDRKLMGDLLHPSADGYMKWAERIAGEITRLLRH